LIAD
jgi:hypothetical protein